LAATLLAALAGGGCGFLLGRAQIEAAAYDRLTEAARQSGEPFVSLLTESSTLLAQLDAAPFAHCSDAETAFFRELLLHSEYLRDAGHMHNGRIECSTLFSRDRLPSASFQPAITTTDGLKIYRDLPPFTSQKWVVFLLQRGDSFVVEDLSMKRNWTPPNLDYQSTMRDLGSGRLVRPGGKPLLFPGAIIDRETRARLGSQIYATTCWPDRSFCTSVFQPYRALLWTERGPLAMNIALGAGSGMALVLLYFLFYDHSRNMSQQLRRSIRSGDLKLVYQPIVELSTGRVVEAEALARWSDEDGFSVSPEIFVRLAVERGFIGELTEWVVRRALSDLGERLRRHPEFRVNVNVTAADLADENFLPMLESCLREHAVAARSLAIEITEGSSAQAAGAADTVARLRQRGHSVQIDDFGTGYSSLAYLKDLAVDTIKIDKAFTQAIGTDAVTVAILPQMLAMAESLKLLVIAEGIETAEQAAYYAGKDMAILGQGWFFGRPAPTEDLLRALAMQDEATAMAGGLRK
jgi:sensor c-di-GMP phosphodiesterase-like protein